MQAVRVILIVLECLAAVALIAVVLLQSGKSAGLSGAIAGNSDSFMSRGKATTIDAKISRATKWIAASFIILCFVLDLIL